MVNQENRSETVEDIGRVDKNSSGKGFLFGAIIGGIAGAAAALYFRKDSDKDIGNLLKKGKELGQLALNKGSDLLNVTSENASGLSKFLNEQNLLHKVEDFGAKDKQDQETKYVSIVPTHLNKDDIQKKLLETQRAIEEEEQKIKA
jgi:gas vesicle protein